MLTLFIILGYVTLLYHTFDFVKWPNLYLSCLWAKCCLNQLSQRAACYLASSTNLFKLFCITLSNSFILLYRASASSVGLLGISEETSPVASLAWLSTGSFVPELPAVSACVADLLSSIFTAAPCLHFAAPAKSTASGQPQKRRNRLPLAHAHGNPIAEQLHLSCHFFSGLCRGGSSQHGLNHGTLRFLVPLTSDLQMATETVLYHVGLLDRLVRCGTKDARSLWALGEPARGRQLLRLWLGEHGGRVVLR